jgi:hypothetical protein
MKLASFLTKKLKESLGRILDSCIVKKEGTRKQERILSSGGFWHYHFCTFRLHYLEVIF